MFYLVMDENDAVLGIWAERDIAISAAVTFCVKETLNHHDLACGCVYTASIEEWNGAAMSKRIGIKWDVKTGVTITTHRPPMADEPFGNED